MRMIVIFFLSLGLLFSARLALAETVTVSSSVSASSSQSGSSSEASFTGQDGQHTINDDVIEIRHGQLTVNGVPYGTVKPESAIRYSVQGDKKALSVDGKDRPLRR
jgi:hypothetical protein